MRGLFICVPAVLGCAISLAAADSPRDRAAVDRLEKFAGKTVVFDKVWLNTAAMTRDKGHGRFILAVTGESSGMSMRGLPFFASEPMGFRLADVSSMMLVTDGEKNLVRLTCAVKRMDGRCIADALRIDFYGVNGGFEASVHSE